MEDALNLPRPTRPDQYGPVAIAIASVIAAVTIVSVTMRLAAAPPSASR